MKILDCYVEDPRTIRKPIEPRINIRVDSPVEEVAGPISPANSLGGDLYRLIPCGMFYALEYRTGPDSWEEVTPEGGNSGSIGDFNTLGWINRQLVYVRVSDPEEVLDLYMDVKRARRLLRRHADDYCIILDEQAALLSGGLQWRVELSKPMCYGGARDTRAQRQCRRDPRTVIVYRGAHLNVCDHHLPSHQARMREYRQTH